MECPICFGSTNMTTHCHHSFCSTCMNQHIRTSLLCPLCRQMLLNDASAVKAHNESIRMSLLMLSNKKRKTYWWKYRMLYRAVDRGALHENDVAHELMRLLLQIVGEPAHDFIHEELVKAILCHDYMDIPFEDWRTPFEKLK